eukprot:7205872-Lingulodinium_polyedra.AAC.1
MRPQRLGRGRQRLWPPQSWTVPGCSEGKRWYGPRDPLEPGQRPSHQASRAAWAPPCDRSERSVSRPS